MVAARLGPNPGQRARKVAWDLVDNAAQRQDAVHGSHQFIRVKDADWVSNTF